MSNLVESSACGMCLQRGSSTPACTPPLPNDPPCHLHCLYACLPACRGSEGPQDGGSRRGDEDSEHHQLKRGSNLEAARVAYSIAFFGFGSGSTTSPAHLFAQHAQQLAQHMSLHDWQEQQLQQQQQQQPRRWRKPQRRDWVDRVAHRALKANSSSSSGGGGGYLAQARDHLFRPRHDGPVWAAPVRAVTGALQAAQHGVQGAVGGAAAGCAEAVRSVQATGRAAVGGVARAGSMVVTPVQHAVQRLVRMGWGWRGQTLLF